MYLTGLSEPWLLREEGVLFQGDSPLCCANTVRSMP